MSVQRGNGNEPQFGRYISVPLAIQLIPKPFDGNPIELREFIQNKESTYEVADPLDYELLFKFVCAKIAGEAKTKLLARTHYCVLCTLDYHAHKAFTSKQGQNESISQWGVRMDSTRGNCNKLHENIWTTWHGQMRN